jgi:hypothetical protein
MRRLIAIMLALAATLVRPSHAADGASAPAARRVQAAGATLTVTPSADSVRAGQPLRVDFIIDRPADAGVTVPSIGQKLGDWEVQRAESLPTDPATPNRLTERLTLSTFETGDVQVPSLSFTIRDATGKETALASEPLAMKVQTRLVDGYDPQRIRDLKGAVDMPLEARWPWVLGFMLAAAAIAWLSWRWWKGRPKAEPPAEPCDTRALRELDDLAARQLPQKGLVLDFYVLLSDTVRRYVEGRFGIRAPEQTTKEFLQAARHHPSIREDHQRMLAAFLRAADMVKFAAQRPGPAECDRGIDAARGFVRESAPAPVDPGHTPGQPTPHEASERAR